MHESANQADRKAKEYTTICQCDSLVDLKTQLQGTEYGNFLQNDGVVTSRIISERAREKIDNSFFETFPCLSY